jgi:hypothetical protein
MAMIRICKNRPNYVQQQHEAPCGNRDGSITVLQFGRDLVGFQSMVKLEAILAGQSPLTFVIFTFRSNIR